MTIQLHPPPDSETRVVLRSGPERWTHVVASPRRGRTGSTYAVCPALAFVVVLAVLSSPASVPRGYEDAVASLPEAHWALVTRVVLLDHDDGAAYADRRIEIPRKPHHGILIHEVGHVVALAYP